MILAWLLSVAMAAIEVDPPPQAGETTQVVIHDDQNAPKVGATVRAIARPGLVGSREIAVGITDGLGRVSWTPEVPGRTLLQANDSRQVVVVAWAAPPWGTSSLLAVLFLAALAALAHGIGLGPSRQR